MIHSLKIDPEFYDLLKTGKKTSELRKNDRNYKTGDTLVLHAYEKEIGYLDSIVLRFSVTHVLENFDGLKPGYCILSIKPI
jgi:ASC-1-like (ASCH) protein